MHRGRLRSPCRSTPVSGPAPRLSGKRCRRRAVWSQRSSLPARRAQRAVPQLRRPAAPALKSLQRSSGVSSLSLSSSPVSALDARVTLKATGISYLVATCSRTTTSPLPVFPTPVVSCFPQSAPGVLPILRLVRPVAVHGLAAEALAEGRQLGLAPATAEPCRRPRDPCSQGDSTGRSCSSPSAGFRRRPACRRRRPSACPGSPAG